MKIIIVLLLFSTECWAQEPFEANDLKVRIWCYRLVSPQKATPIQHHDGAIIAQHDYMNNNKPLSLSEQITSLYSKYKKECWADSSEISYVSHMKGNNASLLNQFDVGCNTIPCSCPYVTKWQHKQPTFEGFMEWLEKK